jgi:nucleoside-diphosphate-sugar epimerase
MPNQKVRDTKPVVIVTGAAGNIGQALSQTLRSRYTVIGLDRKAAKHTDAGYEFDLTSEDSVDQAVKKISQAHGKEIAAVVHLAAYFDFTGEKSPLYDEVNVQGTRNLLRALRKHCRVERFIYSSTMLVHKPGKPGTKTTEESPVEPQWVYPQSKAETEAVVRQCAGDMPYTLLRLAGLYDEQTAVPTLAHQIARTYEEDFKSHLYAGDIHAGQAFVHRDDMMDAFVRTIDRRAQLPKENIMLVGEDTTIGYEDLQNRLGRLIHGDDKWRTISLPQPVAKAGAWVEEKAEPLIPDEIDHGEKPFIRPFMIDMASDHYELDISRARELLGWEPRHNLYDTLEAIISHLKSDPLGWYKKNRITPPDWMTAAREHETNPNEVSEAYHHQYQHEHREHLWAHFFNMGLGLWLLMSAPTMNYTGTAMAFSDLFAGVALIVLGFLSLSWRQTWARWAAAGVGLWLLFAPLLFWTTNASAYLNSTLVGMLAIAFAVASRPAPGVSPAAAMTGPTLPPGWDVNPSSWVQRIPIIVLALVGLVISRYLTAYQLGHIDTVWEPFFSGSKTDPQNGTEEIITSSVSEAWPVPDAGLGALTYALEILTGLIGSTRRWRIMPWLIVLFGIMIVPLGVISITFIIIQPIVIGTWCTLCLIAAAAMLVQIPYSLDELVATGQFLYRRKKAGRPLLKVFFSGDTDIGKTERIKDDFHRRPLDVVKDIVGGGVNLPWNMMACIAIGVWLMCTRLVLGNEIALANWEYLIGALIITVAVCAFAEVARPARFLIIPLAAVLFIVPFVYDAGTVAMVADIICGAALIALSFRRGRVEGRYGDWNGRIV